METSAVPNIMCKASAVPLVKELIKRQILFFMVLSGMEKIKLSAMP